MKLAEGTVLTPVVKIAGDHLAETEDVIVEEMPLTIYLNGQELVTMLCSPGNEWHLVTGFLATEGMIKDLTDLRVVNIDIDSGLVWVETNEVGAGADKLYLKRCLSACCGRGRVGFYYANDAKVTKRVETELCMSIEEVFAYQVALENASEVFRLTGGVHGGGLAAEGRLIYHCHDIGRHNVFDKLYGYCLEHGISTTDKVVVFTGRVSSEIVLKVGKMNIPVIIARAAPTSLALGLAEELGITVIAFSRGERFNVYTHPNRVLFSAP
ncbi:MAG: fdhD [Firmicutes bacterium]|nr:fdhD [Bacillota bacterium]